MSEIRVIRENETKKFLEGDEYCKLYFENDKSIIAMEAILRGSYGRKKA